LSLTQELESEVASHVVNPKNYGVIENADGVGVAKDAATSAYIIMYLQINEDIISDVKFSTSGNQDTNALGSMLSEMILGDTLSNVDSAVQKLEDDVKTAYNNLPTPKVDTSKEEGEQVEAISTVELDNASMVLTSYRAALRHFQRKQEGIKEDNFTMNISKMCPYSQSDCVVK